MTKKNLVWRLGKLPSPDEVRELVKDKIITQEEARDILFSQETEEERDKKSLESEIKFLRELVDKLSQNNQTRVVEVIKEIKVPYVRWQWYQPYQNWGDNIVYCASGNTLYSGTTNSSGTGENCTFSAIKTF